MGQVIRVSTTVGTIPTFTAISGGTVTTDTNKTSTLLYTGTDIMTDIYPATTLGQLGSAWVYVASATPKLARVLGVTPVDLTNPSALIYALILDRAMPSVSGATANYIIGDLKSWSCTNQGAADGELNEVNLESGSSVNEAIQYPFNTAWLEVKTFDATGTEFLLTENR